MALEIVDNIVSDALGFETKALVVRPSRFRQAVAG